MCVGRRPVPDCGQFRGGGVDPNVKVSRRQKKPSCLGFAEQHLKFALQPGQDGVERKNIGIGFSS